MSEHGKFPRPRAKNDVVIDLKPSKKNSELPLESRQYMGMTVFERIDFYCAAQCKIDPCLNDCILLDGNPGNPLSRIAQFCRQCLLKKGVMTKDCKGWDCHLKPCAP